MYIKLDLGIIKGRGTRTLKMIATSEMIKAAIYVQFRSLSNIIYNLVRSFKKFKFSLNLEGKIRTIGKRDRNEVENFLQAE